MHSYSEMESKILHTASAEFLEKGMAGTRMQKIADKAGINKALLHYYFRSKEQLYYAVAKGLIGSFFEELISKISVNESFEHMLKAFIDNYIDKISAHPDIVRFMLWELQSGGKRFKEILNDILSKFEGQILPILPVIDKAMEKGEIRKLDPAQLMINIISLSIYPYLARPILELIIPNLAINTHEFSEVRKKEVYEIIWNYVKPITTEEAKSSDLRRNIWLLW